MHHAAVTGSDRYLVDRIRIAFIDCSFFFFPLPIFYYTTIWVTQSLTHAHTILCCYCYCLVIASDFGGALILFA